MAKLKRTGLVVGIWDLTLLGPNGFRAAMEIKTSDGVLTESQKDIRQRYLEMGVPHAVCRSIEDARAALIQWRIPLRETYAAPYRID